MNRDLPHVRLPVPPGRLAADRPRAGRASTVRLLAGFVLAGHLIAGSAAAQAATQDPVAVKEREALTFKAKGLYIEAHAAFAAALEQAVRRESLGDGVNGAPVPLARAEFLLLSLNVAGQRSGDRQATLAVLDRLATDELRGRAPYLTGLMDILAMGILLDAGRAADALKLTRKLGLIGDWMVVGPFDNERGRGFKVALEPERGFDPAATFDGKKRQVAWRRVDVADVVGAQVELDAILRPNDQCLAYAATCVESETEQPAALRVGTDEAVRAWVNGVEVLAHDARRTFVLDQDAVGIRLKQGRNRILLKVCDQEGPWSFAARLTTPGGAPLAGVRFTAEPEALRAAWAVTDKAAEKAPENGTPARIGVERGAEGVANQLLESPAATAGADARDLFHVAGALAYRQRDDDATRRDRTLARQAAQTTDPADAFGVYLARYLYAYTLVRSGGHAAEKEENERRRIYEELVASGQAWPEVLRSLAEMEVREVGRFAAAEALLRRAREQNKAFANALVLDLEILAHRDMDDERAVLLDRLGATKELEGNLEIQWQRGELAARRGELREQAVIQRQILDEQYAPGAIIALSQVLFGLGDGKAAKQLVDDGIKVFPFARELYRLGHAQAGANSDWTQAAAYLSDWLGRCPEDDEVILDLAAVEGRAGRADKRLALMKKAVDLNPNLEEVRRHVRFLESREKPFFDEFAVDGEALVKSDPGAPADARAANDSHYYLIDQHAIRVYRDGTSSSWWHFVARILTEEGTRRFDTFWVPHSGEDQDARVLEARVFKKDGSVVRAQPKRGSVDLPTLAIGDAVEIACRVDDLRQSYFGDYFGLSHDFASSDLVPVLDSRLDLVLDGGRPFYFNRRNGAPEAKVEQRPDGTVVQRYRMTGVPRHKIEVRKPDNGEVSPIVEVSTYKDWDQFATWWWNLIRKQTESTPEIQAKVAELTAGKSTELEKIRALYEFVITDVRYKAWEFGIHGYKPYSAAAILARRHGDCKDKAILLNALLAQAGIRGYPVLIDAQDMRSKEDLTLPIIGHFNHCISYLPAAGDRPAMFLDGTAQYHDVKTVPDMDQGATVLVVEEGKGVIQQVPWVTAADNRAAREFTVRIQKNGDAEIDIVERSARNQAIWVRDRYGNEPGKRKERLEDWWSRQFGKVEVVDFTFSDLLDLGQPVEVRVKLRVKDFVQKQGEDFVLKSCFARDELVQTAATETREHDLLLGTPNTQVSRIQYQLPEGFDPVGLPQPITEDGPHGRFAMSWRREGKQLLIDEEVVLKAPRVPAKDYPAFKDFAERIEKAQQQILVVRPAQ